MAVLFSLLATSLLAQDQPDILNVDQAVKIALANNRILKITSLQLDDTKESYLAFKTHRYPTFNTYVFGSQVLAPFSFTVQAGQFGTYTGHRADSGHEYADHDSSQVHRVRSWQRVATAADALQNQYRACRQGAVGGYGRSATGGQTPGRSRQCAPDLLHGAAV